jgi:hypothetical protein
VAPRTSRRLVESAGDKQTTISFADERSPNPSVSMLIEPARILVGAAAGEFGGGLWSSDRQSGKLCEFTSKGHWSKASSCGALADDDTVGAIAEEPWNSECVVAAVGVVHFEPHGRIVEVCGTMSAGCISNPTESRRVIFQLGALTSLSRRWRSSDWRAAATRCWHRAPAVSTALIMKGVTDDRAASPFKNVSGFFVSFEIPGVVAVMIAPRDSVNGGAPILVLR